MSAGETQDPATGTLIVATAIMVATVITVVMILAATTADMVAVAVMLITAVDADAVSLVPAADTVTVAVTLITEGYRGKCKRSRCHKPDAGYDCPLSHPVTSSVASA
ncbi:MAG: hypothetical protein ACYCXU_04170 [Thermoleophilia bacterium]